MTKYIWDKGAQAFVPAAQFRRPVTQTQHQDRDVYFRNGAVRSPADGKHYTSRAAWDEHLKRNDMMQFGNDRGKNITEGYGDMRKPQDYRNTIGQVMAEMDLTGRLEK